MKNTKLVVGILMIILSVWMLFQSLVSGISNTFSNNHSTSGTTGLFVAILWITAGIVYLCTKKQVGLGGDIANMILLIIASLLVFSSSNLGGFEDLQFYAWVSLIVGIGFFVWHLILNKRVKRQ